MSKTRQNIYQSQSYCLKNENKCSIKKHYKLVFTNDISYETYRIKVFGLGNDGKTTFVDFLKNGRSSTKVPSAHCFMFDTEITFETNHSDIKVIFETENPSHVESDVLSHSDAQIVMLDLTKDNGKFIKQLRKTNILRIILGNKHDLSDSLKVHTLDVEHQVISKGYKYFNVSAKTGYNCNEAMLYLLRILTKDCTLEFIIP